MDIKNRFNINDVDWHSVMVLVDRMYQELLVRELGEDSEAYKLLKNTTATDFIYVNPSCDGESYIPTRNNDFFGQTAETLTEELQQLLYDKFSVPEIHAKNIYLRNLPSPAHHSCWEWSCHSRSVCAWVNYCP